MLGVLRLLSSASFLGLPLGLLAGAIAMNTTMDEERVKVDQQKFPDNDTMSIQMISDDSQM